MIDHDYVRAERDRIYRMRRLGALALICVLALAWAFNQHADTPSDLCITEGVDCPNLEDK